MFKLFLVFFSNIYLNNFTFNFYSDINCIPICGGFVIFPWFEKFIIKFNWFFSPPFISSFFFVCLAGDFPVFFCRLRWRVFISIGFPCSPPHHIHTCVWCCWLLCWGSQFAHTHTNNLEPFCPPWGNLQLWPTTNYFISMFCWMFSLFSFFIFGSVHLPVIGFTCILVCSELEG